MNLESFLAQVEANDVSAADVVLVHFPKLIQLVRELYPAASREHEESCYLTCQSLPYKFCNCGADTFNAELDKRLQQILGETQGGKNEQKRRL